MVLPKDAGAAADGGKQVAPFEPAQRESWKEGGKRVVGEDELAVVGRLSSHLDGYSE